MNYETYAPVLEKAKAALAKKNIPETAVSFCDVRMPAWMGKAFWFVSGVKRKMKRRLGK
ncbi:MAG: hypothetical protein J6Q53_06365 [Oscillospiraceae bacterium]|nr:hypothetical protein [Oscillospiraceae bacterium]